MALHIPLSWLQDFVDCSLGAQAIAEHLTVAGLEVEEIQVLGNDWSHEHLVVGELVSIKAHPNADRLSIVQVKTQQEALVQVVTGAPNIRQWITQPLPKEGLKGALALPGAKLIDGHCVEEKRITLKKGSLRGEASNGMLCSEKELGLSDAHEGIILLPPNAAIGAPLKSILGDETLMFDIKGGFAHLLSVLGIARELAAITQQTLKPPEQATRGSIASPKQSTNPAGAKASNSAETPFVRVEIADPALCRRYTAVLISGVDATMSSPFQVQQRLNKAGMRPINAVVDATNYVMLEYGQPLHAFDYALLTPQGKVPNTKPLIQVRTAKAKETLTTLDGIERTLDPQMLLITKGKEPVGLAGVMGGMNSEINDTTQDILLEAANFDFLNIRRTSHELKLRSEAAERFGKRLSPSICMEAALRCAELIVEWCGGSLHAEHVDVYPTPPKQPTLQLPYQELTRLLGTPPPPKEVVRILHALDFEVEEISEKARKGGSVWRVTPPLYRLDIQHLVDLVEEVARIHGYDHLPTTQLEDAFPAFVYNARLDCAERVQDLLCANGLQEMISYSLVSSQHNQWLYPHQKPEPKLVAPPLALRNPLSAERSVLRTRLLPEVLTTLARNTHHATSVALFEFGRVFLTHTPQAKANAPLPHEAMRLCAAACGQRHEHHWTASQTPTEDWDFYDMKGVAETLLQGLGIEAITWERSEDGAYHPGRSAQLRHPKGVLGHVGELHPSTAASFDLGERCVCVMELDADFLVSLWQNLRPIKAISQHPPVHEDVAFVVDEDVPAGEVRQALLSAGAPLVRQARLFDVYQHAKVLGEGKKSLAFALVYQSFKRTLTEKEAERTRKAIAKRLKTDFSAVLRDG